MGRPTKEDALIKKLSAPQREPANNADLGSVQRQAPIAEDMFLPNHSGDHIANNIQAKKCHIVSNEAADAPQVFVENTRTPSATVRFGIGELTPLTGAVTTQEAIFSANITKINTVVTLDDTSAYGIYFYMLPKWAGGNEYFGFNYAEPQANPVTTMYYPFTCDMVKNGAISLGATTNGYSQAVSGQAVTINTRATTHINLVTKAKASQTGDLFQAQTSTGTVLSKITPEGYFETSGQKRVANQFNKTNDAALANVTGLSVNLTAGKLYIFKAKLFVDADAVGGHKYAIAGTATATEIIYQISSIDNATFMPKIMARQVALGGTSGESSGTNYWTEISGLINVDEAGTLTVQFAQNVATPATTSSVLTGSYFIVEEIA